MNRWIRLTVFLLITGLASHAQAAAEVAARIVDLRGQVEFQLAGTDAWEAAQAKQLVNVGTTLRTGKNGWAAIRLEDETLLHLNKNTVFRLREVSASAGWHKTSGGESRPSTFKSVYRLFSGEAWVRNKNRNVSIDVQAPNVTASIRGTELYLRVAPDNTSTVTVLEGRILASNSFGGMDVAPGEQVIAAPGKPLVKRIVVNPGDAVQWTLVVPPLIESPGAVLTGSNSTQTELEQAYNNLTSGEIGLAREQLLAITRNDNTNQEVWRLLSLAELTLNNKEQALVAAKKAVAVAPDSPSALVVLGYTYQAMFDLDKAEQAFRKALVVDEDSVIALINLARVQFGSGLVAEAAETIDRAGQLDPAEAEGHNLRGFILLALRDVDAAIAAFDNALTLEPGLGESYMGLGIAQMRQGQTDQAIESITTAVLLEPRRSLFMSYWAKMLYQIGRFDKALDVLVTAQHYDPNDPTPELYRSMILRDLNRPTEAIQSLNQAMTLNNRRAVYRSRFLLDQDLAVKNVDLSQIYGQLGLDRWARKKAIDSIKLDYTNHAGHTFLAGSMERDADRSWSFKSERLLGRLLQPANLNSFNTYNEYTSLFEKPAFSGTATLIGGTQGTAGLKALVYGAQPSYDLAYQIDATAAKTDGWRATNGETSNDLVARVNWDLTPDDGFMFAASYYDLRQDDLAYSRFEHDAPVRPDDRWKTDGYWLEAGYHHRFSPGKDLLVFLTRHDDGGSFFTYETSSPSDYPEFVIHTSEDLKYERPYSQAQTHMLWQLGSHQLMGGFLYYDMDNNLQSVITDELEYDGEIIPLWSLPYGSDQVKRYTSAYVNDIWRLSDDWTLEGAIYFEHMDNSNAALDTDWTVEEVNPRLGLIWQPAERHTVRLAAYRYLLPIISERLDPTDVAGITMFRDIVEGSLHEEMDLVWEYEWDKGLLSLNPFYSQREFKEKTPLEDGSEVMVTYEGEAKGVEVSWNQLLWRGVGLAADYEYLDTWYERQSATDRREHLLRLTLSYVHPSGFSAELAQTVRDINSDEPDRPDEIIPITDLRFAWEYPEKSGSLLLQVQNLFDEKFNWVTDQFVTEGRDPTRQVFVGMSVNF